MTKPLFPFPPGAPGPGGAPTLQKGPVIVAGPDSTTIEILADILGARGTQVNVRAAFTTNGTTPSIVTGAVASGYVIGDQTTIRFQVVPPRRLSAAGVPVRPYTIKCIVEAVNAVDPLDKVVIRFDASVPTSTDFIQGLKPIIVIDGNRNIVPVTSGPTTTTDAGHTVVTTRYVTAMIIQDPQAIQVLGLILGSVNSAGIARLQITAAQFSPPDPNYPTLPAYGGPFSGDLTVGSEAGLLALNRVFSYRGPNASKKLFIRTRATDFEDSLKIYVMELELDMQSHKTFTTLDVLVRLNGNLFLLEDLPLNAGVRELAALDFDTIEILLRATGDAGTQVMTRVSQAPTPDILPAFPDINTITSYDAATGVQKYSDTDFILGVFGTDDKIAVTGDQRASALRALSPGTDMQFRVDATSTVNVSNHIERTFRFRAIAPLIVTAVKFFYRNSRNPDAVLPVQAGTDVNGTIIGLGTLVSPFFVPVDKPEQIEFFAVPTVTPGQLVFLQTAYAYEPTPITEFYPAKPEDWSRGFSNNARVNIHPHPVPPGELTNRPLTGSQFILASGSKPVADGGDGKSKATHLRVVATGVGNAANIVDVSIWVRVFDPAVVVP